MPPYRLLVLSSHPIQYQAPIYRALAAHPEIDLTVLFCLDWGAKPYRDPGFGCEVRWDTPLLDGYKYRFLRNWSLRPGLDRMWGVVNPGVVRAVVSDRYDAVVIYGWARATNWLAIVAALASRTPIILRDETNLLNPLPRAKKLIKIAVLKKLFSVSSAFLSIGRYNTEFYTDWGVPREKIHLSPYSVDNEFWLAQADKFSTCSSQLKRNLGFAHKIPIILFSGKLTAIKRPFDLLRAFEQVSRKHACGLVFLGDGRLRKGLEAYARKRNLMNVRFVGFKNQKEMAPFYAIADASGASATPTRLCRVVKESPEYTPSVAMPIGRIDPYTRPSRDSTNK
jgi:glycosyltransferase involved in cell wall biosynthesis